MMRKANKNSLLEIIVTLYDAHNVVQEYIEKRDNNNASSVLSECRNAVVSLQKIIKRSENDDCVTIGLFQKYYDELCNAEALIERNKNVSAIKDILDESLVKAENSVIRDIKVRLEIAFMPYNVNMWDTLESIWLAARDDENCDAYVVPIPYYIRNTDGSFGEFKYDGNKFPEYVPVVDYRNYDFRKRKPDAIYIINPYDEFNYVTSVDPNFYSYELKKYTGMLVYVPYFVGDEIIEDNYCQSSAVQHADRIIVQSESVKRCYARYTNINKLLVLGSPKIDKVISTKKEDIILPDEWSKLIKNKKVILYNTHLRGVMESGTSYLSHLQYILNLFESRDDVVLWWRPHPLAVGTIKSMNPAILSQYNAIVDEYKMKKYGIYDDTENLHRAIAISDVYYGDASSVNLLSLSIGKPALIQNASLNMIPDMIDQIKVSAWSFAIKDNTMWFVPNNICGLFSINLLTYQAEFHGAIPDARICGHDMYTSVKIIDDCILLVPGYSKNFFLYDIVNNRFKRINYELKPHMRFKFIDTFSYDKCIYIIPYMYNAVLKYDVKADKMIEIPDICNKIDEYRVNYREYFEESGSLNGDILMIVTPTSNIVIKYNLKTNEINFFSVGNSNNVYTCIASKDEYYWLFSKNGEIVKCNMQTGSCDVVTDLPNEFRCGGSQCYSKAISYKDDIYVFPYNSNMILKIDTKTNYISCLANLDERETVNRKDYIWQRYLYAEAFGEYIYAWSQYECCLQKIDPVEGVIENIELGLSEDDCSLIINNLDSNEKKCDNIFCNIENPVVNIKFVLSKLINNNLSNETIYYDNVSSMFENMTGSCGVKTHEQIKQIILGY